MKKIICICLLIAGCKSKNVNDIKPGMKSSEVISIMGEPAEKHNMFMVDMWLYNDSKEEGSKHVVILNDDTVTRVTTKQELRNKMRE